MKKLMFSIALVLLTVQGCSSNPSLKEDIKDVGQDIKNEYNKATD